MRHGGETKKGTPVTTNHPSFSKDTVLTYRSVNTGKDGDAVAPPGSLGIGKIISLIDFKCVSTGDDEYGRDDDGAPNPEGGRHVKITKSLKEVELDTHNVTCCDVSSENAMACSDGLTDPDDGLKIENICALHFTHYTENTAKLALKGGYVNKATPSLVDVPGAPLLALKPILE